MYDDTKIKSVVGSLLITIVLPYVHFSTIYFCFSPSYNSTSPPPPHTHTIVAKNNNSLLIYCIHLFKFCASKSNLKSYHRIWCQTEM